MTTTTTTRERPIIFTPEMVRAILDGRKTQTRRVVKPQPPEEFRRGDVAAITNRLGQWAISKIPIPGDCGIAWPANPAPGFTCPYGAPGDLLWVRETWADLRGMGFGKPFAYLADTTRADGSEDADSKRCRTDYGVRWKPSIHMPREACRLTLRVTDIRVERVQEISGADAAAEGCQTGTAYEFGLLWDQINEKRGFGWHANPWVWAVTFEKETP